MLHSTLSRQYHVPWSISWLLDTIRIACKNTHTKTFVNVGPSRNVIMGQKQLTQYKLKVDQRKSIL